MTRFETSVLARPEIMSDLTEKVMAFLSDQGVDTRATHHVALVFEEVLSNLATHGNCRNVLARIAVRVSPNKVIGEVIDAGPPFDPRLAPDPPLDIAAADRPIGGLGLHLVRKLSSDLEYARRDGENFMRFAISRS
jgi:anti-sigma regulatory factor (Ser/Thr protein kinase)